MHVTIVCATSLDGKLSNVSRDPVRFTSRKDRARLHGIRDRSDAIVIGAGTLRAEDPPLLPDARRQEARRAAGLRPLPVRAFLSRSLDVPLVRALAPQEGSPVYVFTIDGSTSDRRERLEAAGIRVRSMGAAIDPRGLLRILEEEEAVARVSLEGGGDTNATFIAAGVVDAIELTVCPVLIGGATAPTLVDGPGLPAHVRAKLTAYEATPEGELFLSYTLERPGST